MTTQNNAVEISLMPLLKPVYTDDGVTIMGIGRTTAVSYGVIEGKLTRIEAGERLTDSGSMGMDYLGDYSFSAVRVQLLRTGHTVVYRAGR